MLSKEVKKFLKDNRKVLSVQKSGMLFGVAISAMYLCQLLTLGAVTLYAYAVGIDKALITGDKIFSWALIILNQLVFAVVTFSYLKANGIKLCFACRLKPKMSYLKFLILIILTVISLYGLGTLNYVFEKFMSKFAVIVTVGKATAEITMDTPLEIVAAFSVMGILAPVCEEFLFRGAILSGLAGRGKTFAVILSSLMFAFMHGNIYQLFYQFALGIILAVVCMASNSLIAPIIIHMLNNFLALIFDILSYNPYSSPIMNIVNFVCGSILIILIVLIYIYVCLKSSESGKKEKNHALVNEKPSADIPSKNGKFIKFKNKLSEILDILYFSRYKPDNKLICEFESFTDKVKKIYNDAKSANGCGEDSFEKICSLQKEENSDGKDGNKKVNFKVNEQNVVKTSKDKVLKYEKAGEFSEEEIVEFIKNDISSFEEKVDEMEFKNFVTKFENKYSNVILTLGFAIIILIVNTVAMYI